MDKELERRLREQLDRDEIWRVLQAYARGLDRLDNELVRSCYWEDAIDDHGNFVGRVEDFIAWADAITLGCVSTKHNILNHFCDLQGDDAWCETYFLFIGVCQQPPHRMSAGRYVDHFQRRGGEWRIANRVIALEGRFDLDAETFVRASAPIYTNDPPWSLARDRTDISYHRPLVPRRPIKN